MKKPRVLIIDDSIPTIETFSETLGFIESIEVVQYQGRSGVISVVEALNCLSYEKVDLIFLDINMSPYDGFVFLEMTKGISNLFSEPIVLMYSSSDKKEDYHKSMEYDMVKGYINKMQNMREIFEVIEKTLKFKYPDFVLETII